jgi:hypothetical protein
MQTHQLHFHVKVSANLHQVRRLLQLENLANLNPLVKSVKLLPSTEAGVEKAEIVDQLQFGIFKFPLPYLGTSQLTEVEGGIDCVNKAEAPLLPGRKLLLTNNIEVRRQEGLISVTETANVQFPSKPSWIPRFMWDWLVKATLQKTTESHTKMYEALKQVAESHKEANQ